MALYVTEGEAGKKEVIPENSILDFKGAGKDDQA